MLGRFERSNRSTMENESRYPSREEYKLTFILAIIFFNPHLLYVHVVLCIFKTLSVFLSSQPHENIVHVCTRIVLSLPRISFEAEPEVRCLILALSAC